MIHTLPSLLATHAQSCPQCTRTHCCELLLCFLFFPIFFEYDFLPTDSDCTNMSARSPSYFARDSQSKGQDSLSEGQGLQYCSAGDAFHSVATYFACVTTTCMATSAPFDTAGSLSVSLLALKCSYVLPSAVAL